VVKPGMVKLSTSGGGCSGGVSSFQTKIWWGISEGINLNLKPGFGLRVIPS